MDAHQKFLPQLSKNGHQKAFFNSLLKLLQKQPREFFNILDKLEEVKTKTPNLFYQNPASELATLFLAERQHLEILGASLDIEGPPAESSNWLERFATCPSVVEYFEKSSSPHLESTLLKFVKYLESAFPHLEESWQALWHSLRTNPQHGPISTSPTTAHIQTQTVDVHGSKDSVKKDLSEQESPTSEEDLKETFESLQVTSVNKPIQISSPIFSSITSGVGRNRARFSSTASSGVYLLDVQLTHRSQLARLGRKESWRGAQTRAQIWISRFGPTSSIYEKMLNLREELDRYAQDHMKIQWSNRPEKRKRSDSDMDSQKE